jgi:hypothetical protein
MQHLVVDDVFKHIRRDGEVIEVRLMMIALCAGSRLSEYAAPVSLHAYGRAIRPWKSAIHDSKIASRS